MNFYGKRGIIVNNYEELLKHMNQAMLANDDDRVALVRRVLAAINHPDLNFKVVHLAGTNGKGSTGSLVAQMLINQGYKVGHFSSPALVDQREQIVINHQQITTTDFVRIYNWISERLPGDISADDLTVFEWFVLIMLQYFSDQKVNWAIVEAGLGGKDDATNAIQPPLVTVFTHIDLDHTKILGNTIKKIAYNKSQIIKPKTTVFVAPNQHHDAITVLNDVARKNQAQAVFDSNDIQVEVAERKITGTNLLVTSRYLDHVAVTLKMLGDFQIDNFKNVVAIYDWLFEQQIVSAPAVLINAAAQVTIPGRLEVLQTNPVVILDGAHNPDAAQRLIGSLHVLFSDRRFVFVLGFLRDKNYQLMTKLYSQVADRIFATTPDNGSRALPATQLQQLLPTSQVVTTAQQGIDEALKLADKQTVIIVTGSFYVVKELFKK